MLCDELPIIFSKLNPDFAMLTENPGLVEVAVGVPCVKYEVHSSKGPARAPGHGRCGSFGVRVLMFRAVGQPGNRPATHLVRVAEWQTR